MALTISNLTTATRTTAGATLTFTITAAIGDWLVIAIAADNAGTNGAASLQTNASDTVGNLYLNRGGIINRDPGAASAGCSLGIWTCEVNNTMSSTVATFNLSPNTTRVAGMVYKVVAASGFVPRFDSVGAGAVGGGTTSTITATGVPNGYTIFGATATEHTAIPTGDADTTNGSWSTIYGVASSSGTATTSMAVGAQWKTVNATGDQTFNPSFGATRDWATNWIELYEAPRRHYVFS
jgi:hypothetical protein